MDRKWFASNIVQRLLWFGVCGSVLVSCHKIPGFLQENVINDGTFLTNDLIPGNGNDGGTIITGTANDGDKHGDCDSEERNGDDKLIRSRGNELPLEARSRGGKRSNVLLLEHLSNLTEIDRDPGNHTIREIIINSKDNIKLYDENDEDDDEEEYEEDDHETDLETSLQKTEPRSIFHLNLLNPHNFLSGVLSENHSKELVRTKRQAEGGGRRRRCRCSRRRGVRRRRRRRRRRGRTGAQTSPGRRRGGRRRRRRRRGGRRRCVCRGRGAGGGGGGGGGGGTEGGGDEGEEGGDGGDEGEEGGEEGGDGGDEGEEEDGGGDEEEGGEEEEAEGSSEVSGEDDKSEGGSDEKSEEKNQSSDESDEKEGD